MFVMKTDSDVISHKRALSLRATYTPAWVAVNEKRLWFEVGHLHLCIMTYFILLLT